MATMTQLPNPTSMHTAGNASALLSTACANGFSIAIIMPECRRRERLVNLLKGTPITVRRIYEQYPSPGEFDEILALNCDAVVIDLDADLEKTLELAADLGGLGDAPPVMVLSSSKDSALLMRVMQTGVRDFLGDPVSEAPLLDALDRARDRRQPRSSKPDGKLLVFAGTKGGAGVSTIATNFAVALRKESCSKVVIVDLDVQLGEVALTLGVSPQFAVTDALRNPERLDADFVSKLVVNHSSGLDVLAAPEAYDSFRPADGANELLLRILRRSYNFVVVDAGAIGGGMLDVMMATADTIYVVVQMSIPSLRNARRMMSYAAHMDRSPRIQVVLNRFDACEIDIREENAIKALARPADWKVPNDFAAVRDAQNSGVPLALENSPISEVLNRMAKSACGKPFETEKQRKKFLGLF
jgi:pilus assembly protein CpaE